MRSSARPRPRLSGWTDVGRRETLGHASTPHGGPATVGLVIGVSPWRSSALAAFLAAVLTLAVLAVPARGQESEAPQDPPAPSGCDVGPVTNFLAADATQAGVISLIFFGAQGTPVEFFECVDDALTPLGTLAGAPDVGTELRDATTWDCARPSRSDRETDPWDAGSSVIFSLSPPAGRGSGRGI